MNVSPCLQKVNKTCQSSPSSSHIEHTIATSPISTSNESKIYRDVVGDRILKPVQVPKFENVTTPLTEKLLGDVVVACGITLGIAPFMTVVDKAIVQRAAGSHTIIHSCMESISNIARHPFSYIRSPMFLMMWGVYAATYTAANSLKTIAEHFEGLESDSIKKAQCNKLGKSTVFFGTTIVNSTTTLLKDQAYARMFGNASAAARVPLISYTLWATRDFMVIGSSFILPEIVSKTLEEQGIEKRKSLAISQIMCPVMTQVVAGPIQLLGLDFYNRPMEHLSTIKAAQARIKLLGDKFFSIFGARVARIAPAYGIGGIGNTHFRNEWRKNVEMKWKS